MLEIKRLDNISDIPNADWHNLLVKSETNTLFLTPEWMSAWWETMNPQSDLLLLAIMDSDTLVGIAPLMIHRTKKGLSRIRTIQFIGAGDCDYADFICSKEEKPDVLRAIFNYLKKNRREWNIINLDTIPDSSSTPGIIAKILNEMKIRHVISESQDCFAMAVTSDKEFAHRKLNRKGVKTRFNYLNNRGELTYTKAQTSDEILRELDNFFEFHKDRRLLAGDDSKFNEKNARDFYKKMIENLLPKGWLRFDIVKFNGEPIAYHFGFNYNNKHVHYTPVLNIDYYKRSPGMILIKYLIEDCLENDIDELDFTRGAEEYKKWFSNVERKNYKIEIYRGKLRFSLAQRERNIRESVKAQLPYAYGKLKTLLNPSTYFMIIWAIRHTLVKNGIPWVISRLVFFLATGIYLRLKIILFRMILSERDTNWTQGDFEIRIGKFSDLKEIAKDSSELRRIKLLRAWFERMREGQTLIVVEKDSQIVHYSWADITDNVYFMEMNYTYKLPRKMWYLYHSYTYPGYRGLGIYTAVLRYTADMAADAGAEELCGYVLSRNFVPQKGIQKTGAMPYAGIQMTRILFIKRVSTFLYENRFTKLKK